ncbi:MAG: transposase [Armatimonadetes bacterium]|nr:transposase [Armatimonadota bacterium]
MAAVVAGGHHVLSRLRADTVFYDLPPARRKGKDGRFPPGRPRRYGAKHQARTWSQMLGPWRTVSVGVYGRRETRRLKSRVVLQRSLGVNIRLVAVAWGQRPVVFLFGTDTPMTPEAIGEAYAARFAIETGFRDAKQSFGLTTYQVRRPERLRRLLHLCLWSQTLLRLACWHLTPEPIYGAWRKPLAYLTLAQQQRRSRTASQVLQGSKERGRPVRNGLTISPHTREGAVGPSLCAKL